MFSVILADYMERLTLLRRNLHAHPELSNKEVNTTTILTSFLKGLKNQPEIIEDVGGGFLAIFDFSKKSLLQQDEKIVVFRAELDAIPLQEKNEFEHKSSNHGVAHQCGHDGHMAILMGLALILDNISFKEGKVVLLFQPAEEIGSGAQKMVECGHPILRIILANPNSYFFALHNIPGFPKGSVVLPRGTSFASASKGMHVKLKGACSHASQPHLGRNPALAMCNIIQGLLAMPTLHVPYDQKALVTIVGARMGEKAFGVSAGDAEVMATLRATTNAALAALEQTGAALAAGIAMTYGLSATIEYEDAFPATVNDREGAQIVTRAAEKNNLNVVFLDEAFPWSEDFGVFLQYRKGAMFGLGAGETHAPLHSDKYDFPDSLIPIAVNIFATIMSSFLGEYSPAL